MKITVIGTGYVGLVTGACLADFGLQVTCIDNNHEKIYQLNKGIIPIYEPGLEPVVVKNVNDKRLNFSDDLPTSVKEADVIFIAVGTPSDTNGNADLAYVKEVAASIAECIGDYKVIVNKSTVPIGTGKLVKDIIKDGLRRRSLDCEFDVVSNPEFLREGAAIYDFTHPDRVVIGCESSRAAEIMKEVYRVLYLSETPFMITDLESAELIKYASNAFLALKITFINEIANLCEKVGADIREVSKGIGKDGRIGPKFLHAGPGYGGSCFPKDTRALSYMAQMADSPLTIIDAAISANEKQKLRVAEKLSDLFGGDLSGKTISILGLSFKPNTDDMREAPSLAIIEALRKEDVSLKVYDPVAQDNARALLGENNITYCKDEYEAMEHAEAVVIVTEWNQFRNLDFNRLKKLVKNPILFDLRNIYRKKNIEKLGIKYFGIGQ